MSIVIPYPALTEVCQRYQIRRLAVFGSALREDFNSDSDVDVLVEFEEGCTPDFFRLYDLEQELSGLFGDRAIDLVTYAALNPLLQPEILATAEVHYERG